MIRYFLKHKALPTVYAVEADEDGTIMFALDVTDEATKGGLCLHMLDSLPLAARVDDVLALTKDRFEFLDYEPECGNTHHLMTDLLELEERYRDASDAFNVAHARASVLKKQMEGCGDEVHALLRKIRDRKPLPLFAEL